MAFYTLGRKAIAPTGPAPVALRWEGNITASGKVECRTPLLPRAHAAKDSFTCSLHLFNYINSRLIAMCLDALFDERWNLPIQSREGWDTHRDMSNGWMIVQS